MTFKKRTSLSNLADSSWMQWAIQRTGVPMPNCVTYATARISEILNRKEYLDDPRVSGAQELWNNYSKGFRHADYAEPGALMIWKSGQYGHVAVCEDLLDIHTIAWSQSNYGGAMFGYVKGNPNGYKGMQFLGYLLHEKLTPPLQEKPEASQTQIQPGQKVNVKAAAKYYSSGERIPEWVKKQTYTVQQINGNRVLLKEILSWVSSSDLQPSNTSALRVQVGSKVRIKKNTKRYASGEQIPAWVKNQKYTIQQIKDSRLLLKEIQSWVFLKDIE